MAVATPVGAERRECRISDNLLLELQHIPLRGGAEGRKATGVLSKATGVLRWQVGPWFGPRVADRLRE